MCLCAGEDPAHVAAMAVAAVTGLQGGSASPSEYLPDNDHIVCEAKHCCAYGAGGRDGNSADVSQKTLHDVRNPHEPSAGSLRCSDDLNDIRRSSMGLHSSKSASNDLRTLPGTWAAFSKGASDDCACRFTSGLGTPTWQRAGAG